MPRDHRARVRHRSVLGMGRLTLVTRSSRSKICVTVTHGKHRFFVAKRSRCSPCALSARCGHSLTGKLPVRVPMGCCGSSGPSGTPIIH